MSINNNNWTFNKKNQPAFQNPVNNSQQEASAFSATNNEQKNDINPMDMLKINELLNQTGNEYSDYAIGQLLEAKYQDSDFSLDDTKKVIEFLEEAENEATQTETADTKNTKKADKKTDKKSDKKADSKKDKATTSEVKNDPVASQEKNTSNEVTTTLTTPVKVEDNPKKTDDSSQKTEKPKEKGKKQQLKELGINIKAGNKNIVIDENNKVSVNIDKWEPNNDEKSIDTPSRLMKEVYNLNWDEGDTKDVYNQLMKANSKAEMTDSQKQQYGFDYMLLANDNLALYSLDELRAGINGEKTELTQASVKPTSKDKTKNDAKAASTDGKAPETSAATEQTSSEAAQQADNTQETQETQETQKDAVAQNIENKRANLNQFGIDQDSVQITKSDENSVTMTAMYDGHEIEITSDNDNLTMHFPESGTTLTYPENSKDENGLYTTKIRDDVQNNQTTTYEGYNSDTKAYDTQTIVFNDTGVVDTKSEPYPEYKDVYSKKISNNPNGYTDIYTNVEPNTNEYTKCERMTDDGNGYAFEFSDGAWNQTASMTPVADTLVAADDGHTYPKYTDENGKEYYFVYNEGFKEIQKDE